MISQSLKKVYLKTILFASFFVIISFFSLPDKNLHLHFLDVGQGDGILIETPEKHLILVDGGPDGKVLESLSKSMNFYNRELDLVILSHPDADHINGLLDVLKRLKVKTVLFNGIKKSSRNYYEFLRLLKEKDVDFYIAFQGQNFKFGNTQIEILYPFTNISGEEHKANNTSIIFKLKQGHFKALFTGDIEKEVEDLLVKKNIDLTAGLLKVPHHGSNSSSTLQFLNRVKPKIAVIQSEKDNNFGHPHPEIIKRLYNLGIEEIYRNDESGNIEFVISPKGALLDIKREK